MVMTFFVLFANEIKVIVGPKSADYAMMLCLSICLFFFILEFVLASWSKSVIRGVGKMTFKIPYLQNNVTVPVLLHQGNYYYYYCCCCNCL
jgi:hypothetical protein